MSTPVSPATRFNLKNVLGANPTNMSGPGLQSGRNVPASKRETCCFCIDLRYGVVAISCFYLFLYVIQMGNMIYASLQWGIKSKGVQGFDIFCLVVGLPMNVVGLVGAIKKKHKLIYAYFLFNCLFVLMNVVASIAVLVQVSRGAAKQMYHEICTDVIGARTSEDVEYCVSLADKTAKWGAAFSFLLALLQIYWSYIIRRLYLQILIQNTGVSNYMQV